MTTSPRRAKSNASLYTAKAWPAGPTTISTTSSSATASPLPVGPRRRGRGGPAAATEDAAAGLVDEHPVQHRLHGRELVRDVLAEGRAGADGGRVGPPQHVLGRLDQPVQVGV